MESIFILLHILQRLPVCFFFWNNETKNSEFEGCGERNGISELKTLNFMIHDLMCHNTH